MTSGGFAIIHHKILPPPGPTPPGSVGGGGWKPPVSESCRNPALRKTLRSVVEMLSVNGVVPILEGVELPENLAWLRATVWNAGVQGFAVGRPRPGTGKEGKFLQVK